VRPAGRICLEVKVLYSGKKHQVFRKSGWVDLPHRLLSSRTMSVVASVPSGDDQPRGSREAFVAPFRMTGRRPFRLRFGVAVGMVTD
jgi:hypothetical protein